MDEQMIKKLKVVLKDKLLNEIKDKRLVKALQDKTKTYIINYIIDRKLISEERINELYYSYKDSFNAVLYLLESNIVNFNSSTLDDEKICSAINEINTKNVDDNITDFKIENVYSDDNEIIIELTYKKLFSIIYGGIPIIDGYKSGDILDITVLKDVIIYHYRKYNNFIIKCNVWSAT